MSEFAYKLENMDLNKTYSYADYLIWRFKERVELFKGKIWAKSPAPCRRHQKYSQNLNFMHDCLVGRTCDIYTAPFDVRLLNKRGSKLIEDVYTVFKPYLCVICDRSKLDDLGYIGAPDLVAEILSPDNSKREMDIKFDLYPEAEVIEYWIVQPADYTVLV